MKTIRASRVIALVSATSVLALSAPAFAQDADDAEERVDPNTIIVTAQKREQNLDRKSVV